MQEESVSELTKVLADVKICGFEDEETPRKTKSCTALVYDEEMMKHRNIWDSSHIEVPERISRIYRQLVEDGLVERCLVLESRKATKEELSLLHSLRHIDEMESTCEMADKDLFSTGEKFDSVYLSKDGYNCALLSAGSTLAAVESVMKDEAKNAVAVVRPPGHHACCDYPMGFCYFNNVAIAAKKARQQFGAKRVLIVDWDIHYGNGTHLTFADDPSVLYFSIHRFDNGQFWPCLPSADYTSVGEGHGTGYNIHVPWNKKGKTNGDYLAAFDLILLPVAQQFCPDLVIVSCGFDCGINDPRGHCKVTPPGFAQMTSKLMGLAEGRLLVVLEGGYNLSTISSSMSACVSTLLGDPCPTLPSCTVSPCGMESIRKTAKIHSSYWSSLSWACEPIPDVTPNEASEDTTSDVDLITA